MQAASRPRPLGRSDKGECDGSLAWRPVVYRSRKKRSSSAAGAGGAWGIKQRQRTAALDSCSPSATYRLGTSGLVSARCPTRALCLPALQPGKTLKQCSLRCTPCSSHCGAAWLAPGSSMCGWCGRWGSPGESRRWRSPTTRPFGGQSTRWEAALKQGGSEWCRAAGWSGAGGCERSCCLQAAQYF